MLCLTSLLDTNLNAGVTIVNGQDTAGIGTNAFETCKAAQKGRKGGKVAFGSGTKRHAIPGYK